MLLKQLDVQRVGESYSFSIMSYNNPIVFTTCPIVFHDVDKKYPILAMDV